MLPGIVWNQSTRVGIRATLFASLFRLDLAVEVGVTPLFKPCTTGRILEVLGGGIKSPVLHVLKVGSPSLR